MVNQSYHHVQLSWLELCHIVTVTKIGTCYTDNTAPHILNDRTECSASRMHKTVLDMP